ncbi:hypothetical protein QQS21_002213 [Conoideocrella luteorostrata]|uniref:Uncharacterized protein n=1 Tax=Conoideocrella luteorostrata TaxID=1105319 RepID=A0AAJ0CWL0_9HYPO|nr:hypothetical protein QQS21_002213 [Conoideocrella luteorostrata]
MDINNGLERASQEEIPGDGAIFAGQQNELPPGAATSNFNITIENLRATCSGLERICPLLRDVCSLLEYSLRLLGHIRSQFCGVTRAALADLLSKDEESVRKGKEIETLKVELNKWQEKAQSNSAKLDEAESSRVAANNELQAVRVRESQLRDIILKNSGVQKSSDEDIRQLFLALRQQLQIISRSRLFDLELPNRSLAAKSTPEAKDFYSSLAAANKVNKTQWLQSGIFNLIHNRILTANCFGFGQALNRCDRQIDLVDNFEALLQSIETFFIDRRVGAEVIADWRLSTMKCVELSKAGRVDESKTVKLLLSWLKPLMVRPSGRSDCETLERDVRELCERAYKVRLLMRNSKDRYFCRTFDRGQRLKSGASWAEVYGVEAGGNPTNEVAFTLFGALVKCAVFRGEDPVVLEKAQVVVSRRLNSPE